MDEARFRRLVLAVALAGVLHGLVYLPFVRPHRTDDTQSYTDAAHAILHGRYATPLPPIDITTLRIPEEAQGALANDTFRTPGYPLVLAAAGGGTSAASEAVVFSLQAALMGLSVLLLALTARQVAGPRVGLAAAALYALDPFSKRYVGLVLSETLAGALTLLTAYLAVRAWKDASTRLWAGAGLAAGALVLTRPLLAPAVALVGLGAVLAPGVPRLRLTRAVAALATAAALLVPWVGWHTAVTGKASLSSFGEGWNLLLAAHGEGPSRTFADVFHDRAFLTDFLSVHRFAPTAAELRSDRDAHGRYLARADAEQRRLAEDRYRERLGDEPLTVAAEVGYRGYFLWMAHEDWYQPGSGVGLLLLRLADWAVLGLALLGAGFALVRGPGPARGIVLFLLVFTAVNALHHVEARYSIPVRGLYLALAAATALRLAGQVRARA